MVISDEEQNIIKKLKKIYQANGFLSENVILNEVIEYGLNLDKIDYICDKLLSSGVIISDEENLDLNNENEVYDRSQTDYEQIFNRVINIDTNLKQFIDEIRQIRPPQHRELENLIIQAKNDNLFARERIINMYLRTVVRIALWHYDKYKIPLADAIQDGCIGLVIALNKFELNKQENFSRYAPWWIRQNIFREAGIINSQVYFPQHVKEKLFSIYKIIDKYCCNQYEENIISPEVIKMVSEKLNCNYDKSVEYINYLKSFESIEQILKYNENDFSDNGKLEDDIIQEINNKYLKQLILQNLTDFKSREVKVIKMRFGFIDGKEYTLEEIGNELGVTRERIRQIQSKVIRKFQHTSRCKKLRCFLE